MEKIQYRVNKIAREMVKNSIKDTSYITEYQDNDQDNTQPCKSLSFQEPISEKKIFRRPKLSTTTQNNSNINTIRELSQSMIQAEKNSMNETDPLIKESWIDMVKGCKSQIDNIKNDQRNKKEADIDIFVRNAKATQFGYTNKENHKEIFEIAKNDAENRIYKIVSLSYEDIAIAFSTKSIQIDCNNGPVIPGKGVHSWFHDLRKRENNNIPLGPDIKVPKKKDFKTGEFREIQFTVSRSYDDPKFVNRCKAYYSTLGINFSVNQDARIKNKYWINLKVDNPSNKILFPSVDGTTFGNFDESENESENDNIETNSDTVSENGVGWDNPFGESIDLPSFADQVVVSSVGWETT
jgi:hypothetical protein